MYTFNALFLGQGAHYMNVFTLNFDYDIYTSVRVNYASILKNVKIRVNGKKKIFATIKIQ